MSNALTRSTNRTSVGRLCSCLIWRAVFSEKSAYSVLLVFSELHCSSRPLSLAIRFILPAMMDANNL